MLQPVEVVTKPTQVVIRNDVKRQCPGCRTAIRVGDDTVRADGQTFHVYCGVDENRVAICTDCFMITCEC